MAKTVDVAFSEFMRDKVSLDSQTLKTAQNSRDILKNDVKNFQDFLPLFHERNINFGSFARGTKIRMLDTLGMIFALAGEGCSWQEDEVGTVTVSCSDDCVAYQDTLHPDSQRLDSHKILQRFLSALEAASHFEYAQLNDHQSGIVLKLKSFSWTFNVVPAFFMSESSSEKSYYLLPDGKGNWVKADPRIDQQRLDEVNSKNHGRVTEIIKVIKYWQRHRSIPKVSEYLIENLVLNYFDANSATDYMGWDIRGLLSYLSHHIYKRVADPQGLQDDLNTLTYEEQQQIADAADTDYHKALKANDYQIVGNQKDAIQQWQKILGYEFPNYG